MEVTSVLVLIGVGALLTTLFFRNKAKDEAITGQVIESEHVVQLLKKQREKKRKRLDNAEKNYLEVKADYERKFGPITNGSDPGDGPSSTDA